MSNSEVSHGVDEGTRRTIWSLIHETFSRVPDVLSDNLHLKNPSAIEGEDIEMSGETIDLFLNKVFGDSVHIIHPDLLSTSCLFEEGEAAENASIYLADHIVQSHMSHTSREKEGPDSPLVLTKPVIMIVNTSCARSEGESSHMLERVWGSHWIAIVILPRNFYGMVNTRDRKENATQKFTSERVYFYDSIASGRTLPQCLLDAFQRGKQKVAQSEAGSLLVHIPPILSQSCEVFNYSHVQQQATNDKTCGLWALYNAVMTVLKGDDSSWKACFKHPTLISNVSRLNTGLYLRRLSNYFLVTEVYKLLKYRRKLRSMFTIKPKKSRKSKPDPKSDKLGPDSHVESSKKRKASAILGQTVSDLNEPQLKRTREAGLEETSSVEFEKKFIDLSSIKQIQNSMLEQLGAIQNLASCQKANTTKLKELAQDLLSDNESSRQQLVVGQNIKLLEKAEENERELCRIKDEYLSIQQQFYIQQQQIEAIAQNIQQSTIGDEGRERLTHDTKMEIESKPPRTLSRNMHDYHNAFDPVQGREKPMFTGHRSQAPLPRRGDKGGPSRHTVTPMQRRTIPWKGKILTPTPYQLLRSRGSLDEIQRNLGSRQPVGQEIYFKDIRIAWKGQVLRPNPGQLLLAEGNLDSLSAILKNPDASDQRGQQPKKTISFRRGKSPKN